MAKADELWIPLVDEPIGSIVASIQQDDPELDRLVSSPHRLLAFRTFAYIRVGLLLGELLMELDVPTSGEPGSWAERLLETPEHREAVVREVRAVAEEVAADPAYGGDEPLGPDDETRDRFREFARQRLEEL